jgi:hypothetical protein
MIMPQLTEQYGQVLRVSVVLASLKLRVSASAAVGEKPNATRLDAASPAPLTRKNCLRFMSMVVSSPGPATSGRINPAVTPHVAGVITQRKPADHRVRPGPVEHGLRQLVARWCAAVLRRTIQCGAAPLRSAPGPRGKPGGTA